jgi:hypothetical protein
MFIRYTPENAITNVFYLKDTSTGEDWYNYQKNLDTTTLKIAVNEDTNDIDFSFYDASTIFPVNCNIFHITDIPDGFIDYPYSWKYINGEFVHPTDTEWYKEKIEANLVKSLKIEYTELKLQNDLGVISSTDKIRFGEVVKILSEKYSK